MRTLIATVFNYSLDGLLADEGTVCGEALPRRTQFEDTTGLGWAA
jgi:hypothetical protein